jgi:hypothetical protein
LISSQEINEPSLRTKAHRAIKELVDIYEGQSPEETVFAGAQEVIDALQQPEQ